MTNRALCDAISKMHAAKARAYGNAWKKRGEVMSIMANIARKVDRLELVAQTGVSTKDESILDTAVDLLVYCIKHQTYLADLDHDVRRFALPSSFMGPASDGTLGFDAIWQHTTIPEEAEPTDRAIADVLRYFASLEALYVRDTGDPPVQSRWEASKTLSDAALHLVAGVARDRPDSIGEFIRTWGASEAKA